MTETFFVTKYALTDGIKEVSGTAKDGMLIVSGTRVPEHYHGADWWRSRADAAARAEIMRNRKLASLAKQADRLRALTF